MLGNNPFTIVEAVALFLLFKKISSKEIKIVNLLSGAGFMVYLLHANFLKYLKIEKFATGNTLILVLHLLVSAIAIYLIYFIINLIYSFVTKPLFNYLGKKFKFLKYEIKEEINETGI